MSEYSEIKRLVAELIGGDNLEIRDERYLMSPAFGIQLEALVADNESLHKHWENESNNVQVMLSELIKLKAEVERFKTAISDATYRADQGKVWNGMGWTYTGLSAHAQRKVLDILDAANSSPENS